MCTWAGEDIYTETKDTLLYGQLQKGLCYVLLNWPLDTGGPKERAWVLQEMFSSQRTLLTHIADSGNDTGPLAENDSGVPFHIP